VGLPPRYPLTSPPRSVNNVVYVYWCTGLSAKSWINAEERQLGLVYLELRTFRCEILAKLSFNGCSVFIVYWTTVVISSLFVLIGCMHSHRTETLPNSKY